MALTDRKIEGRRFLYVCEGTTDEDRLKKLSCRFVLCTGGKFIRKEILPFLEKASKRRDIVLVLDPDGPGRQISMMIEKKIGPCIHIEVRKKEAIKKEKVGIAQVDMRILSSYIQPFVEDDKRQNEKEHLSNEDIIDLNLSGETGKERREILIEKLSIPYKSLSKVRACLEILAMDRTEVEEVIGNG